MNNIQETAKKVVSEFQIEGKLEKIKVNTQGHINSTFVSTFNNNGVLTKYTHQKINSNVFKKPKEVMENILLVTRHIAGKVSSCPDKERRVLQVIPCKNGLPYYEDEDGEIWRTYIFIENVNTYEKIPSVNAARNLGKGIGNFQKQLSDFDGSRLNITIPHFHDMGLRYRQLEEAIKADPMKRVKTVEEELDFLFENRQRGCRIWDAFESGTLPNRVTHNDTKMNNVLFDPETDEAVCVIDLDTIMPGTILFDTGDMIRTACNTAEEDEKDLSKVSFNKNMYDSLISGYLEKAEDFLTKEEREGIKESGRTITQIMAVRFLTDYIAGDVYYHTAYSEHNLVRTRCQLALIKSMDEQWDLIK